MQNGVNGLKTEKQKKSTKIFLIPGYACDGRLFNHYPSFKNMDTQVADFILPLEKENLQAYIKRFIHFHNISPQDIILGVSLGGMMAIEIQKELKDNHLILVSTILHQNERPFLFRFLEKSGLYIFAKAKVIRWLINSLSTFLWKDSKVFKSFLEMFNDHDNRYLTWGAQQAILYKNTQTVSNYFRLHGDKDPLFDSKKINQHYSIENGNHAMIRLKGRAIKKVLDKHLEQFTMTS